MDPCVSSLPHLVTTPDSWWVTDLGAHGPGGTDLGETWWVETWGALTWGAQTGDIDLGAQTWGCTDLGGHKHGG